MRRGENVAMSCFWRPGKRRPVSNAFELKERQWARQPRVRPPTLPRDTIEELSHIVH
jgi:hypothetical protein